MKKLLPIFLFVLVAGILTSAAIITSADKGWSKKEQKEFMKSCTAELKGQKGIDAKGYCSCMLDKVMEKYPNPDEGQNIDQDWMKKEAVKCLSVTSDNYKAPWSESEQSNFMNSCVGEAKKKIHPLTQKSIALVC